MASELFRGKKKKRGDLSDPDAVANDGVLPSEMLSEILRRLPARELCRLRLVCRSWRSLTSDPNFSKAHAARHQLFVSLRCDRTASHVQFFDLSGNMVKQIRLPNCRYQMSVHVDLLCIYGTRSCQSRVLNTATTASYILPDVISARGRSISLIGLVPSTGEYKVLRIHSRISANLSTLEQSCQVITLGMDGQEGWRTKQSPPISVALNDKSMASVDGVTYFLLNPYGIDHANIEPDGIASFDLRTEEWRAVTLQGPLSTHHHASANKKLSYREYRDGLQLATLDGRLVTIHHTSQDSCSMNLWFLEDAGKRLWIKKYCLDYEPNWTSVVLGLALPYPLMLLDDGRIVIWVPLKKALTTYDPETRTWARLATMSGCYTVQMHEGSLLSSRLRS